MEFREVLYQRRSVRHYADQSLSRGSVEELLDAAVQAPSAMNEQPWVFVVIQDPVMLKRYSETAKSLILRSPFMDTKHPELKTMLGAPEFNIFYNSSTLIVIFAKPVGQHPDWDCCLAGENLMLAATNMGLATCPIGLAWPLFALPEIRQELKVPEEYTVVLPIIVGYPGINTAVAPPRRPPEIASWH